MSNWILHRLRMQSSSSAPEPTAEPHTASTRPRRRAHCPRVRADSLTAEAFYERFLKSNRPCILTGATDSWGAVQRLRPALTSKAIECRSRAGRTAYAYRPLPQRTHLRHVYVRCTLTSLVRYRLPSHHRWRHEDGTPNIDELMHGALRAATVPVDVDIEVDGVSSGARQTVQMTLEEYAAWWTRQVRGVCMM